MLITVLGFIAMFLLVFAIFVIFTRNVAGRAQAKEDSKTWREGERRRTEAKDDEAWRANRRMPMK